VDQSHQLGKAMRIGVLKLRAQIYCGEVPAIGPGKADLLEAIDHEGSIAAAGRALGMSYRRSWVLVDEMNRCFQEKLVETLTGGGRDRGARLSRMGHTMLNAYRELERELALIVDSKAYQTLTAMVFVQPLPAKVQATPPRDSISRDD
jgi:molybdate transport system regulatory protein